MSRIAEVSRVTKETDIYLKINLDGTGKADIDTGVGFFDHMLEGFAKHGLFDVELKVKGDLKVDCHHTIEDTGIVLGEAIKKAVGSKKGIKRYGNFLLPMDETLVMCGIDLSGRPYYSSDFNYSNDKTGDMDNCMVDEFFYALSYSAMMNLHFVQFRGSNDHHITEAAFKAFAKSLDMAVTVDDRIQGVLSTKGTI
ncbi:MAG: imidazoleglycerol-phosphate dehydratase HisB [Oscillospiraceae bacterium]|nr:imidazoleglycerol-phosphate dehydratase HisB [Oscillospiraceae bacterium]